MASAWSDYYTMHHGGKGRCHVNAYVSATWDTSVNITVEGLAEGWQIWGYGVRTQAGQGGGEGTGAGWAEGTGWLDYSAQTAHTSGVWNFPRRAYAYTVTCWCKMWGETVSGYGPFGGSCEVYVSVTVPALPVYAPRAVKSIKNTRNSDSKNTVTWTNDTDATHPYANVLVERKVDGGSWAQVASLAGSAVSYADTTTSANHIYAYRVRPSNAAGYGPYATSSTTYNTPGAPTAAANTRNSDSKNTVTWTNNANSAYTYTSVRVERQIDGGSWAQIASLSGSAASYADTGCQANHAYCYRVRAYNSAGYSGYATSGTTYNTPAAPTGVKAVRKDATTVTVSWTNPANTETATVLQRSSDASTWTAVKTISSANATSADDVPGGGTYYYRVQNTRVALASAWSDASNAVVTLIAPAAPTLKEPASGVVVPKTQEDIAFSWNHNPIDGSTQTAAQVQCSADGGTAWTTTQVTGSQQKAVVANQFEVNADIVWRVRTKGTHADYGAWSENRVFRIRQVPSIAVSSPGEDGAAINDLPLVIAWEYDDESGIQQQAEVVIKAENGAVLFARSIQDDASSTSIDAAAFLPKNAAAFLIEVSVTSTSSLTATATRSFVTDYDEPAKPEISLELDRVHGSVLATCFEGVPDSEETPKTVSLGIFRRTMDGRAVSLADRVPSGTGTIDICPPLDQEITYVAVAYTDNGLTSSIEGAVTVPSDGAVFFNFGSGWTDVAKVAMDMEWDTAIEVDSEIIETDGDEDPLVFYGTAKRTQSTIGGDVWWRAETAVATSTDTTMVSAAFEAMSENVGIKMVRYPFGPVVPSNVVCKISSTAANPLISILSISAQKVRRPDGLVF